MSSAARTTLERTAGLPVTDLEDFRRDPEPPAMLGETCPYPYPQPQP